MYVYSLSLTTEVTSQYTLLKIPMQYGRITDILIIFDTFFSRQAFITCLCSTFWLRPIS